MDDLDNKKNHPVWFIDFLCPKKNYEVDQCEKDWFTC